MLSSALSLGNSVAFSVLAGPVIVKDGNGCRAVGACPEAPCPGRTPCGFALALRRTRLYLFHERGKIHDRNHRTPNVVGQRGCLRDRRAAEAGAPDHRRGPSRQCRANGDGIDAIRDAWPVLTEEQIEAAVLYARAYPRRGRPGMRPSGARASGCSRARRPLMRRIWRRELPDRLMHEPQLGGARARGARGLLDGPKG